MKPTKIYTFTVPANAAFPLLAMGDFFKIQAATGPVEVRGDTFGTIGGVLPGQGLERTPFNRLEFRDISGGDNQISLLVADQAFVDDRISGEVSVIDGNTALTKAGLAFIASANASAAPGNLFFVQLHNKSTDTLLRLNKVRYQTAMNAAATGAFSVQHLFTNAPQVVAGTTVKPAYRKNVVGVPIVSTKAEVRACSAANLPAGVSTVIVGYDPNPAAQIIEFREPLILRPGCGFCMQMDTQMVASGSANLGAVFEFVEESIL
ncbi:hypothetical protein [Variovorax sp. UMC13]|uniref:hypothetical protein n=1 Tax=Variovorax sp. UMC13 TaxID=1862326 RepID=UPI00160448D1|nr:hypothetical protein [Variovorax sp. UMC13]MBB1602546.1 hypothetical protein [Variovorax sp. UMC13]